MQRESKYSNYIEQVVILAQQENKGGLTTITMKTGYNENKTQCTMANDQL
jgi:hypothetical protein